MSTQVITQATPTNTPRGQQAPSSSSTRLMSTDPIKTRILREIYEAITPNSFSVFALFSQIDNPLTFEEVVEEEVWSRAMGEEIECIEKNQTWELVDVPKDKDVTTSNGFIKQSKMLMGMCRSTRKVWLQGGSQSKAGIDFNETFAHVAHMDTIRTVLVIAAQNKWLVYQMDVKLTLLNGY